MDLKTIKTNYPCKKFLLCFNILGDYDDFTSKHNSLTEAKFELDKLIKSQGSSFYATISEVKICFSLEKGRDREVTGNSRLKS